ncbi:MAG TPA: hypothetical protein VGQ17_13800 [Gemmatimonadales bacterium]|nr:hypothetical protein [Gemmatimonadales bacterium]
MSSGLELAAEQTVGAPPPWVRMAGASPAAVPASVAVRAPVMPALAWRRVAPERETEEQAPAAGVLRLAAPAVSPVRASRRAPAVMGGGPAARPWEPPAGPE